MAKFVIAVDLNSKERGRRGGGVKAIYLSTEQSYDMQKGNSSFTKNKIFMLLTYIKQKMECFLQGNYFL